VAKMTAVDWWDAIGAICIVIGDTLMHPRHQEVLGTSLCSHWHNTHLHTTPVWVMWLLGAGAAACTVPA
jgi:hypothetical protein